MAATDEELYAAMAYMRVPDEPEELDIVRACYEAAQIYLKNSGVEKPDADTALYNLAIWSLCLHYYDHRDAVGTEAAIPIGLRPIINQLKQLSEIPSSISN